MDSQDMCKDVGFTEESERKVFCSRCGRVLVGIRSKKLGYGHSCYRILQKEKSQQIKLFGDDDGE